MRTTDFNELVDNRSDPAIRSVLEDLTLTNGAKTTRLGAALWMIYSDAADVDDAAAADDDDDGQGGPPETTQWAESCDRGGQHCREGGPRCSTS